MVTARANFGKAFDRLQVTWRTLKWRGSPTWGPSSDHHGSAPVADWVTNLSVKLGLTPGLPSPTTHIGASSEGLRKGAEEMSSTLCLRNRQEPS